jgi:hypothetical protein
VRPAFPCGDRAGRRRRVHYLRPVAAGALLLVNGRYGQRGQQTMGHSLTRVCCQCMQSRHLAAIAAFGSRPEMALSYFFWYETLPAPGIEFRYCRRRLCSTFLVIIFNYYHPRRHSAQRLIYVHITIQWADGQAPKQLKHKK